MSTADIAQLVADATPADIAFYLRVTCDEDEARGVIDHLTGARVKAVAHARGITVWGKVDQMRQQLLYWSVQRRLDCAAVSGIR